MRAHHTFLLTLSLLLSSACSGDTSGESGALDLAQEAPLDSADDGADDAASSEARSPELAFTFTHKMMKATDENPPFSSLAYECFECSVEQHAAIVAPEGWTKGPVQRSLVRGELRSRPSFEGVEDAVDFIEEVPGEEYELIAKNISGKIIETGEHGIFVEAQVIRDTLLRFEAGGRVHEFTDPERRVFVLFAHEVAPEELETMDFEAADALGEVYGPEGWTYSTRILDAPLLLDTSDVATVLAIRGESASTWELR